MYTNTLAQKAQSESGLRDLLDKLLSLVSRATYLILNGSSQRKEEMEEHCEANEYHIVDITSGLVIDGNNLKRITFLYSNIAIKDQTKVTLRTQYPNYFRFSDDLYTYPNSNFIVDNNNGTYTLECEYKGVKKKLIVKYDPKEHCFVYEVESVTLGDKVPKVFALEKGSLSSKDIVG